MQTIRIISSQLDIVIPIWVRQKLDIGLNNVIHVTPVCGMLLLTAGEESELYITNPKFDTLVIKKETLDIVGLESYDLVELVTIGCGLYIIPYQRRVPKCRMCGSVAVIDLEGINLCFKCGNKELDHMVVM